MYANAYTNDVESVIEMFADGTTGESTLHNRLITVENDAGNAALVGYGEKVLAEYDEVEGRVTVFLGHKAGGGDTVSRWLNTITEEATARRNVTFSDNAPWFRPPNADAAGYIDNYFSFGGGESSVERAARDEVIDSLKWLNRFL